MQETSNISSQIPGKVRWDCFYRILGKRRQKEIIHNPEVIEGWKRNELFLLFFFLSDFA